MTLPTTLNQSWVIQVLDHKNLEDAKQALHPEKAKVYKSTQDKMKGKFSAYKKLDDHNKKEDKEIGKEIGKGTEELEELEDVVGDAKKSNDESNEADGKTRTLQRKNKELDQKTECQLCVERYQDRCWTWLAYTGVVVATAVGGAIIADELYDSRVASAAGGLIGALSGFLTICVYRRCKACFSRIRCCLH